jgi:hypothetical protein
MMRNRSSVRRALALAAFLVAPLGFVAAAAVPASASISPGPDPIPLPGICETVPEVKAAQLVKLDDGSSVIVVTGTKLHANSRLQLTAEDIDFVQQPEYFPYLVEECNGSGVEKKTPFREVFRVPSDPMGKFGISIHGIDIDLFPHV